MLLPLRYVIVLILSSSFAHTIAAQSSGPRYIEIEVPDASLFAGEGTNIFGIDEAGDVAGTYTDTNDVEHGFFRTASGFYYSFGEDIYTSVAGVNSGGLVVGSYLDFQGHNHGYVAEPGFYIQTIDVPKSMNTEAVAINSAGVITGTSDLGAFVYTYPGPVTPFSVPGASTVPTAINDAGVITGYYEAGAVVGSFIRDAQGNITTFQDPNAGAQGGTYARVIGSDNEVFGIYRNPAGESVGFARTPSGQFQDLYFPGTKNGLTPVAINASGTLTGTFQTGPGLLNGFLRSPSGTVTQINVPGFRYTEPTGVNGPGIVAGTYLNGEVYHGFIRLP